MIKFNITYDDKVETIQLDSTCVIDELKANIVERFDLIFENVNIILSGYGVLNDLGDLPISSLELSTEITHLVFVHDIKNSNVWKNYCTKNISGIKLLYQQGYCVYDRYAICYACRKFCCGKMKLSYELSDKDFICQCPNCIFNECHSYDDMKLIFNNINSILTNHAHKLIEKEKIRIQQLKNETLSRVFDFQRS
jgi:hypothetical protein